MGEDDEFDEDNVKETPNYLRFGKGKNSILVGKNQLTELLDRGMTTHQALLELAGRNEIGWVKGGEICQKMMTNQYIYLRNLGVPHEKIVEHFHKEFPVEYHCLVGEALSPEEIKKNIAALIMRFSAQKTENAPESPPVEPQSDVPEPVPGPVEEGEAPSEEECGEPEAQQLMLGNEPVETEEDLELWIQEKEGWCCGTNPKVLSIMFAIEHLKSEEFAKAMMKDYIMNHWKEPQLFEEACKHCDKKELVDLAFNNIATSKLKEIVNDIIQVEGEEKAKELYSKYLSGEIKSLWAYFDKTYMSKPDVSGSGTPL